MHNFQTEKENPSKKQLRSLPVQFEDEEPSVKELIDVSSDGNCFFLDIHLALRRSDSVSLDLRYQAVDWVEENFDELSEAVHGTVTLDEYVALMSKDEPEVRATSHIISRPLLIFTRHGKTAKLTLSINPSLSGTQIMLYLDNQHYSLLENKFKIDDLVLVNYDGTLYPGEVLDY